MKRFLLFFCLPLLTAAADIPLFTVPVSRSLPVIDGVLAENEWKDSVTLGNFMRIGDNRFASEQSKVMVRAAGKTIFFGFRFNEYALDKSSNQYKSFKASLKGKNQPVWENDSMEIRIAPPWIKDQRFFYIGFSAGGATKVISPNGFNKDVESAIKLAVKENNGFWCAELAIPVALLNADVSGEWKINLVRFEKRLPENSSYCPLLPGEHGSLGKYAVMRFSDRAVPVVQEQDYSRLSSLAKLPVILAGASWQGEWQSSCSGRSGKGKAVSPGKNTVEIPPLESGYSSAEFSIGDFYHSPAYPCSRISSKIKLSSASEINGMLNGKIFRDKSVMVYPDDGINELVLTLAPGAAVELTADTELGIPVEWKFSSPGIRRQPLDKGEKFINGSQKAITLSARFLQRGTAFVPPGVDKQNLFLTENGTYIFLWDIHKTRGWDFNKPFEKAELHLYLPASVEFLGVDNRVKYPDGFDKLKWPAEKQYYSAVMAGRKKLFGTVLEHWIIKRNAPVKIEYSKSLLHHQEKRDRAAIFLRGRKGSAGSANEMFFYHARAFDGQLGELPQMLPVRVYPELKGAYVPDLTVSLMNYWADDLENQALTTPFYETLIAAGVNEVVMDTRFAPPPALKLLARIEFERVNWRNTYPDVADFMKKYPESLCVNHKGMRDAVLSISYLLEHPELHNDLFMILVKLKKNYPFVAGFFFDIEADPFTNRWGGDFSPASLARFARKYKISEKLTPALIKAKYAENWIAFRGSEIGEFTGLIRSMLHRLGMYCGFYTDYDSPQAIRIYTADWKYLNGAVDRAYMGYGRDPRLIANTRKKLPATPLVFGLLTWTNTTNFETVVQLQRIIDSKGGVLMWFARGFGAREAMALAEATRCYDRFRPYFLSGKRVDEKFTVTGLVQDEVIAFELEGKVLLILLNNTHQNRKIRMTVTEKSGKALTEFFSGRSFVSGKPAEFEIPPRSAAVFCGELQINTLKDAGSSIFIRNASFEEIDPKTSALRNWSGRKDCTAAVRSAECATDGKYSALFSGDGTKNALIVQHLDKEKVLQCPKLKISLDLFVDSLEAGMIIPIQLIVVTHENGKRRSNYPGARIFSRTGDGMGSWVRVSKEYDLSKYRNISSVELWITGWNYHKNMFKGKFFIDNLRISGEK